MKGKISNLQEIKDSLPYADILGMLGVHKVTNSRRNGRSQCPFCMTHNPIAFSFQDDRGWKSFCCGFSGGDVIELLKELNNCTFIEAVELASNYSGIAVINEDAIEYNKLDKSQIASLRMEAQYASLWFRSEEFRKRSKFREANSLATACERRITQESSDCSFPWEEPVNADALIDRYFELASRARTLESQLEEWESLRPSALELFRSQKNKGLDVSIEPIVQFLFDLEMLEKRIKNPDKPYSVEQYDKDLVSIINKSLKGVDKQLALMTNQTVIRMAS